MLGVTRGLFAALLVLTLVLPGCVELAEDQPTPTPIPTPAESNKPVYEVKKGSIIQSVKALGRVAASQEATLYFRQSGRLRRLYVETNQKVKPGDLLAELETGNLRTQIAQAKIQLDISQIKLAQTMQKSGSDDTTVASAKSSVQKAESDYTRSVGELEKLRSGAQTADVKSAEQSVISAEATLVKAKSDLEKLRAGSTPEAFRKGELDLEKAKNSLWASQIDRDATCGRGSGSSCDAANARVAASQTSVTQTEYDLERLKVGPSASDVTNAERTVQTAQASLDTARAKLDQVRSGARSYEVATAEGAIASAQANLDSARANYQQTLANSAKGGDFDVQIQQKNVELARVSLQVLEDELELAQIKAPFEGAVLSTAGREGENVSAFAVVVTIANPTTLQLSIDLAATEMAKVQLNQEAVVVFTSYPTEKIPAKVGFLPSLSAGSDPQLPANQRTVKLSFLEMPKHPMELGSLANVTIATQRKDEVLILPNNAIRAFGGRKYVRLQTASGRKQEVDIEVGISNETETEIIKGVKEGMMVISQ